MKEAATLTTGQLKDSGGGEGFDEGWMVESQFQSRVITVVVPTSIEVPVGKLSSFSVWVKLCTVSWLP